MLAVDFEADLGAARQGQADWQTGSLAAWQAKLRVKCVQGRGKAEKIYKLVASGRVGGMKSC